MIEHIKVTIAVPVYNVESYIKRCLDSLLIQTLKEIEIILVDDGSTDDSGQICDTYSEKDNRIKVLHKKNGGLASARQAALENAHGEYFICCDSDDWVEPTMYEEMYAKAKETDADMVICDFAFNYPDGSQKDKHEPANFSCQNDIIRSVLNHKLAPSTWNKLTRTSIYYKYNLTWKTGINQGEDVLMFLQQLQYPLKIVFIPKVFYHYWRDIKGNSYTNSPSLSTFQQIEYINDWKHDNLQLSLFGKELFYADVDVAFMGLRATGMNKELYYDFLKKRLSLGPFLKYRTGGLKSCIVWFSFINYQIARYIVKHLYKFFYQ